MKFRNGFISNSSSSSFVFAYNKNNILTDPTDIVNFIDQHPRQSITFVADLCDGWDVFTLDMKQKNYLLKHRKRFIKYNQDPVEILDYSVEVERYEDHPKIEIPAVTAYTDVYCLYSYPYEYRPLDVDMSDVPEVSLSQEEHVKIMSDNASDELKEKAKQLDRWYKIKHEREKEARRRIEQEFLNDTKNNILKNHDIDPEQLEIKLIEVDNDSCDPDGNYDYEFAERYFGLDEDTYFEPVGDPDLEEIDE